MCFFFASLAFRLRNLATYSCLRARSAAGRRDGLSCRSHRTYETQLALSQESEKAKSNTRCTASSGCPTRSSSSLPPDLASPPPLAPLASFADDAPPAAAAAAEDEEALRTEKILSFWSTVFLPGKIGRPSSISANMQPWKKQIKLLAMRGIGNNRYKNLYSFFTTLN